MMKYRFAALALAACAATVSVAACSSGSSTSSTATSSSSSPAASSGVTSSAAPTTGPAVAGKTLTVKGSLGTFPVPASAKVVENMVGGSSIVIVFGSVVPADVARFYASALPKAGFSVTTNSMLSKSGDSGAFIVFTGHGYKGNIDSLDQFPGMSVAGVGSKNVTTIIFSPTK
jgi:ABC-type phosphate transport system substrate-binding protein